MVLLQNIRSTPYLIISNSFLSSIIGYITITRWCIYLIFLTVIKQSHTYLLVKTFPTILSHKSEQREKGPAKSIKACVTMVRIFPGLQTYISLRAHAVKHEKMHEMHHKWLHHGALISWGTYRMLLVKSTDLQR